MMARYNMGMAYVLVISDEQSATFAEKPVANFPVPPGNRRGKETVLVLRGKEFTHVATGMISKGHISLSGIVRLGRPLQWVELPLIIPARLRPHAQRIFISGGRLPPKTGAAILGALAYLMPDLKNRLGV